MLHVASLGTMFILLSMCFDIGIIDLWLLLVEFFFITLGTCNSFLVVIVHVVYYFSSPFELYTLFAFTVVVVPVCQFLFHMYAIVGSSFHCKHMGGGARKEICYIDYAFYILHVGFTWFNNSD